MRLKATANNNFYWMLINFSTTVQYDPAAYYPMAFLGFVNPCSNPFIYAARYELVRSYLKKHVFCPTGRVAVAASAADASVMPRSSYTAGTVKILVSTTHC